MSADKPQDAPGLFDLWRDTNRHHTNPDSPARPDEAASGGLSPDKPGVRDESSGTPGPSQGNTPLEEAHPEAATAADQTDTGLPHEARRALVYLLKHGIILFDQKRLLFEALCRHREDIERQLGNLYLRLLLDDKAGVALLLQPDTDGDEDGDNVTLINRRTLTLYETLLLLVLRKHYQERETTGERKVVVDLAQIEARLTPFLPLTNNSRLDRSKLAGALNRLAERRIVASVRGEEERYEITPAIRYLVSADFLQQLLAEYRTLAEASRDGGSKDNA